MRSSSELTASILFSILECSFLYRLLTKWGGAVVLALLAQARIRISELEDELHDLHGSFAGDAPEKKVRKAPCMSVQDLCPSDHIALLNVQSIAFRP